MLGVLEFVIGIVGLGLMVFVHELGHFVAARLCGVHVEVFSLGWGPKLAGFTRNGTTYQVSWFLIGGYCKMKGEVVPGNSGRGLAAVAEPAAQSVASGRHEAGSFFAASPWRRIVISVFGPLFNLLFSAIVFTAIWWAGFQVFSADNRIIVASDYSLDTFAEPLPAAQAGLRTGDRVVAIDGSPVVNFQDIRQAAAVSPGKTLQLTVERRATGGTGSAERLLLRVTPALDRNSGAGRVGIYAWYDPVIADIAPGSPAALAGLRPGDRIVSVAGMPVANSLDIDEALLPARPLRVQVAVQRGGEERTETAVMDYQRVPAGATADFGRLALGVEYALGSYPSPRLGPLGAASRGIAQTWETVTLVVKSIGLLFRGVSIRNAVAGPLQITRTIGQVTTEGFTTGVGAALNGFFGILSLLSVSLFLMNLLPIPAMDGGQIMLFLVEAARRQPVNTKLYVRLQLIGFSLLILLLVFITVNDVTRGR